MKRELKVTISKTGEVQIDVQNATGSQCTEWTEELEKELGGDISSRTLKSEYYEEDVTQEQYDKN